MRDGKHADGAHVLHLAAREKLSPAACEEREDLRKAIAQYERKLR